MQLFNFLIALLFLLIALAVGGYLGWLMLEPLLSLFRGGTQSARLRKAAVKMERVDALVSEGKFSEALKALRRAVVFETAQAPQLVYRVREHHQNILSRCLVIAEETGGRVDNIAEVERLFIERAELHNLLIKALESFQSLKFRREKAGKPIPSWSKTDFEKRIKEIRKELSRNEIALNAALDKLFAAMLRPGEEQIVYH